MFSKLPRTGSPPSHGVPSTRAPRRGCHPLRLPPWEHRCFPAPPELDRGHTLITGLKGRRWEGVISRPSEWLCCGHPLDTVAMAVTHHSGQMGVVFLALAVCCLGRTMGVHAGIEQAEHPMQRKTILNQPALRASLCTSFASGFRCLRGAVCTQRECVLHVDEENGLQGQQGGAAGGVGHS